jgi:pimeloyl-ACP methyl ester carboxylesterase
MSVDVSQVDRSIQTVVINGHRLCYAMSGDRAPTIVLETGLGAESAEWEPVQAAMQGGNRVLRYDRVGRGLSDCASVPRGASEMVEDLRELLQVVGVPGPYLLVGHSFGGLLMRLFAYRYRSLVYGLVLVDAMHEDQFEVFGPAFPEVSPSDPPGLKQMRAFWRSGWREPGSTPERIDFAASFAAVREIESLGNLPLHVLTAGTFVNTVFFPPERREELQVQWDRLQKRFLKLSSVATQSHVADSGHFVQRERPRAVAAVIEAMARVGGGEN